MAEKATQSDHTLEVPKFTGDISNYQLVSSHGGRTRENESIVIASPLPMMTNEQALVLAAWIVSIADTSENFERFRGILKAVLES